MFEELPPETTMFEKGRDTYRISRKNCFEISLRSMS